MGEVISFHCFKKFLTTRCDESETPVGVFRIVISSRDEPGSESSIVFKLLFASIFAVVWSFGQIYEIRLFLDT
jgi:hypothetical protein